MVRRIYAHYGLVLTPEAEAGMRAWVARNPQNKHGRHEYTLEQYGLTEEDILTNLKPFIDHFKDCSTDLL